MPNVFSLIVYVLETSILQVARPKAEELMQQSIEAEVMPVSHTCQLSYAIPHGHSETEFRSLARSLSALLFLYYMFI